MCAHTGSKYFVPNIFKETISKFINICINLDVYLIIYLTISRNTYKIILFLKKMIYNINNEKISIFNYLRNSNVVVIATTANKSIIIVFIIPE